MNMKLLFSILAMGSLIACGSNASKQDAPVTGTWLTDASYGCEVWGYSGRDPTGPMQWSGDCVDGKANGMGTLKWAANPARIPFGSTVSFEGRLKAGLLDGPGILVTTDTYSNVIHTTRIEAVWRDGEIEGKGQYIRESNHIDDGTSLSTILTYEGEFQTREFWGKGRREETTQHRDGGLEKLIEEGQFENNMLNGDGTRRLEDISANGDRRIEQTEGTHRNRSFVGPGTRTFEFSSENGIFQSTSTFNSNISKGGIGSVVYADGDRFEGKTDADGSPMTGECDFSTIAFTGPCLSKSTKLGDSGGIICIVSKRDKNTCLKELGWWVH